MARLFTRKEAGDYVGLSEGSLAQLKRRGSGPRYVTLTGRSVRYRQEDLDEWIEASVADPSDELDPSAA